MYSPTKAPANMVLVYRGGCDVHQTRMVLVLVVVVDTRSAHLAFAAEPLRGAIASYLQRPELQSLQDHQNPSQAGHLQ